MKIDKSLNENNSIYTLIHAITNFNTKILTTLSTIFSITVIFLKWHKNTSEMIYCKRQ